MNKSVPFAFYFLFYAAASFTMPFIVPYLQGLGFNGAQIGLLVGMAPIITLIGAPFWTGLADARGQHRLVMSLTILGAVVFAAAFPFVKTLTPIIFLVVLYSLFSAPINSFADSATMSMLAGEKSMYGRVRLGGTVGWGLVAPLAGLIIQSYGLRWVFWGYAAIMFLAFIVSQKLSFARRSEDVMRKLDLRGLLANRNWIFFLVLAFVGGIAFTSINSYLASYLDELGASRSTVGIALTISTIGELPILFFANRLLKRFGAYGLLRVALVMTGIRLLMFAWLNFTAGVLIFQLLNGLNYPLFWVAGVSYADQNAPEGMKATAQGLMGAMVFGFGAAAGGLAGGLLLGSVGGRWMYLVFGCLVMVSLAVIMILERTVHTRQARGAI